MAHAAGALPDRVEGAGAVSATLNLGTGPLTSLDVRVLDQLSPERGRRLHVIAWWALRHGQYPGWKPSQAELHDVRLVLRGLEHLGRASCRGGWWRAL
jgi:hypothetical protein